VVRIETDTLAERLTYLNALLETMETESTTARRKLDQIHDEIGQIKARLRALSEQGAGNAR